MGDLSERAASYEDVGEFLDNWPKILAADKSTNSPFSNVEGVVITYSSHDEQPTVSILEGGVLEEVYPCLPGKGDYIQNPRFFAEVADYLKRDEIKKNLFKEVTSSS